MKAVDIFDRVEKLEKQLDQEIVARQKAVYELREFVYSAFGEVDREFHKIKVEKAKAETTKKYQAIYPIKEPPNYPTKGETRDPRNITVSELCIRLEIKAAEFRKCAETSRNPDASESYDIQAKELEKLLTKINNLI